MRQLYDVKGSTTLQDAPPRVLQVRLKSRVPLDVDEVYDECRQPPQHMADASHLQHSVCSILIEGESLRGIKKVLSRRESSETVKSFASKESSFSHSQNNFAYWLSFPSAMRGALMSPGRRFSFRQRKSVVPSGCMDSTEDLGLANEDLIRSGSLSRRNSLRRVVSRRSGFFKTDPSLGQGKFEVLWPKGDFNVVEERIRPTPLRKSEYKVEWKEAGEDLAPTPEREKKKEASKLVQEKRMKKTYSCKDYYYSEEIRIIYGNTPEKSPSKKLLTILFPNCCS